MIDSWQVKRISTYCFDTTEDELIRRALQSQLGETCGLLHIILLVALVVLMCMTNDSSTNLFFSLENRGP